MQKTFDVIIAGQGLAGSILALHLENLGLSCLIINDRSSHSASQIAAGILNPITGKRLSKNNLIRAYLEFAINFYTHCENNFSSSFFTKREFIRLFKDIDEAKILEKKIKDPDFKTYIPHLYPAHIFKHLNDTYGSFQIDPVYTLDTECFLSLVSNHFCNKETYLDRHLDYTSIQVEENGVRINEYTGNCLIFCEGFQSKDNPYFNYLPFNPAKGEILQIDILKPFPNIIINCEKWICPTSSTRFKIGATYSWDRLDNNPTIQAKAELLNSLNRILKDAHMPLIIEHLAGVRPCSQDNFPLLGFHPKYPRLGIFNGFGSKGSLMIPFYAKSFSQYIKDKTPLEPLCDISRYNSLLKLHAR